MKKTAVIIWSLFIAFLVCVGLFWWYLAYSSTTDLSEDIRFKKYLNTSFKVTQPCALKRNPDDSNRFSAHYLAAASLEDFENDTTLLKKYQIGDAIVFTSAKKFYSHHVGECYYLLGQERLDSGQIITFEYSTNFQYLPAIWETLEAFLERRKLDKNFP